MHEKHKNGVDKVAAVCGGWVFGSLVGGLAGSAVGSFLESHPAVMPDIKNAIHSVADKQTLTDKLHAAKDAVVQSQPVEQGRHFAESMATSASDHAEKLQQSLTTVRENLQQAQNTGTTIVDAIQQAPEDPAAAAKVLVPAATAAGGMYMAHRNQIRLVSWMKGVYDRIMG